MYQWYFIRLIAESTKMDKNGLVFRRMGHQYLKKTIDLCILNIERVLIVAPCRSHFSASVTLTWPFTLPLGESNYLEFYYTWYELTKTIIKHLFESDWKQSVCSII